MQTGYFKIRADFRQICSDFCICTIHIAAGELCSSICQSKAAKWRSIWGWAEKGFEQFFQSLQGPSSSPLSINLKQCKTCTQEVLRTVTLLIKGQVHQDNEGGERGTKLQTCAYQPISLKLKIWLKNDSITYLESIYMKMPVKTYHKSTSLVSMLDLKGSYKTGTFCGAYIVTV